MRGLRIKGRNVCELNSPDHPRTALALEYIHIYLKEPSYEKYQSVIQDIDCPYEVGTSNSMITCIPDAALGTGPKAMIFTLIEALRLHVSRV